MLGLDTKIRDTVEAIAPTTYVVALAPTTYAAAVRVVKAMEGPNSSREPPSLSLRQKQCHDDHNDSSFIVSKTKATPYPD